jgi:hypothetical protein
VWKGQTEFTARSLEPWTSGAVDSLNETEIVGKAKEVRIPVGDQDQDPVRFAFVTVDRAGHLVSLVSSAVFLVYARLGSGFLTSVYDIVASGSARRGA